MGNRTLRLALSLVGAAGAAMCLTLLSLAMRGVLDVGGFCASGGPYEIAVQCPQSLGWLMPATIVGGLLFVGMFIGFMPWDVDGLGLLAWSALFLGLGWNFVDYGVAWHGHGWNGGFLVPGVLFVLMGGLPLAWAVKSIAVTLIKGPDVTSAPTLRMLQRAPVADPGFSASQVPLVMAGAPAQAGGYAPSPPRGDIAAELERLATLHREGELTDVEYQQAKNQALAGGR